jgi:hypothetical protein
MANDVSGQPDWIKCSQVKEFEHAGQQQQQVLLSRAVVNPLNDARCVTHP